MICKHEDCQVEVGAQRANKFSLEVPFFFPEKTITKAYIKHIYVYVNRSGNVESGDVG